MFWQSAGDVNPAGHDQEQEILQWGKQAGAQPQTLKSQLALGDSAISCEQEASLLRENP